MDELPVDRRTLLKVGAGTVAAAAVGFGAWRHAGNLLRSRREIAARPELLTLLGDAEVVREIGRRYREKFPEEDDPDALFDSIRADLESGGDFATRLDERIRRDFAEDRTVVVDGWILAVTEARQCALLSLA